MVGAPPNLIRVDLLFAAVAFFGLLTISNAKADVLPASQGSASYSRWSGHPTVEHYSARLRAFGRQNAVDSGAACSKLKPCPSGQHCCGFDQGCPGADAYCEKDGTECNCNP